MLSGRQTIVQSDSHGDRKKYSEAAIETKKAEHTRLLQEYCNLEVEMPFKRGRGSKHMGLWDIPHCMTGNGDRIMGYLPLHTGNVDRISVVFNPQKIQK